MQTIAHQIRHGEQDRTLLLVLPQVTLPLELEKLFRVIEHSLPTHSQMAEIARGIATEMREWPEGGDVHTALDAVSGLTRRTSTACCNTPSESVE